MPLVCLCCCWWRIIGCWLLLCRFCFSANGNFAKGESTLSSSAVMWQQCRVSLFLFRFHDAPPVYLFIPIKPLCYINTGNRKSSHFFICLFLYLHPTSQTCYTYHMNPEKSIHFVYILQCKDSTLYTLDHEYQATYHRSQRGKGAKRTRGRGPFTLVYLETFQNKGDALRREIAIKKLSQEEKN